MAERVGKAGFGNLFMRNVGYKLRTPALVSIDLCHGSPITNEVRYHAVGFLPLDYVQ